MKHLYFTCFLIILSQGLPRAQTICDPIRPMGHHCADAPVICDWGELIDYCFSMSPDPNYNGFAPLCENEGTPDNTHWLAFYAGCTAMTMTITPEDCVLAFGNQGIQLVVYEFDEDGVCDGMDNYLNIIHCQVEPAIVDAYTFELTNLTIGQIYYLMIDGYTGSYCNYVGISLTTPCEKPLIEPWSEPIDGPSLICSGATGTYSVSPLQGAMVYNWFLDGTPVQSDEYTEVQITWPLPGIYELCVNASNQCLPMVEGQGVTCITIEVYDVIPIDPPPIVICEYESNPYPPGLYDILLVTPQGCDSLVTLEIIGEPTFYNQLGQFILCDQDNITLSGVNYDCNSSGTHQIPHKKSTYPFCDSIVQFDITCFASRIKPHQSLNFKEDLVLLDGDLGQDATGRFTTYKWYTTNGVLPDTIDQSTLSVRHHGLYCLITSLYDVDSTLLCVDTVCTKVIRRTEVTGGLACQDATLLCDLSATYHFSMHDTITGNGPNPLCAQGGFPYNTHWFAFYAPDSLLKLNYIPKNCKVNNGDFGIQVALYKYDGNGLCLDTKETPAFELGCESLCLTAAWSITAIQLHPGELYYLVINGCKGSTCDVEFNFEYAHPSAPEPFTWEGDIQGADEICANVTSDYSAPLAPPFTEYSWHINDSFVMKTAGPSLPLTWDQGGNYELCVSIEHPCLDPEYDAGKHCYSVKVIPGVTRTAREVYLCKDEVKLSNGAWWSCANTGVQQTTYQQKLDPNCDSIVRFEVICLSPEVSILPPVPTSPGDSLLVLDGTPSYPGPTGATVTWEWTAYNGGMIVGLTDQPTAFAKNNGLYCLTIEASSPNGSVRCSDTDCVQVVSLREDAFNQESANEKMGLYPLPASEMVWVHFDETYSKPGKLLFINSMGQVVQRLDKNTSSSLLEVNVSTWPAGLYTVSFYMEREKEIVTKRMLVVRN